MISQLCFRNAVHNIIRSLVWWSFILLRHTDGRVRLWYESINTTCLVTNVQTGGGGAKVYICIICIYLCMYIYICIYTSSVITLTSPVWVFFLTMCIPSWTQFSHLLIAASSIIMQHATMPKSSQSGFRNMTLRSVFFSVLPNHQVWFQQNTLRRGRTEESQHESIPEHELESQRDVSKILWNIC